VAFFINLEGNLSDLSKSQYDLRQALTPNRLVGLWRMMTGYRGLYLVANLCLGIAALSKTCTYLLLGYFIDHFFTVDNTSVPLVVIALGFVGLALLEGGFTFLSGWLAAQTAEGITRRLRNYLFDHIQHLTFTYHDTTQTGDLIERCTSDVDSLRRFFNEQAIGVGRIILLFLINFGALLDLNVQLALSSVVVVPIVFGVSIYFFGKLSKAYEAYQEQEATISTTLQENLTGVRVVKAFARQDFEIDKFRADNWEKFQRGKTLAKTNSLFWPMSDTLCGLQMLAGFFLGALMAIHGTITIGTYLAYAGLVVWVIFPMRNLGRLIVQTSSGMVSYDRVMTIIKENREPLDEGDYESNGNLKGHLIFDKVGFAYEKDHDVLKDISFDCQPGRVIALLGSTGSGKTTLVNLLPRFYEYTSGSITLDGVELKRYPRRYLRQQIGIVEQEPFLFSRTIAENITYGVGRNVLQHEIEAAAEAAAIHDVILSFPQGYKTLVGEKGVTLSGGQKQRVALARTLLKNPHILILDDSTSSVDTETEAEIRQALQTLMKNRSTFIIAHRIQSIMNADLILVMDRGEIVQRGQHKDLIAQEGIYRKIFDIQTQVEMDLKKEVASV
jgi:ATP-binding cassette, subfamily B, bacterial